MKVLESMVQDFSFKNLPELCGVPHVFQTVCCERCHQRTAEMQTKLSELGIGNSLTRPRNQIMRGVKGHLTVLWGLVLAIMRACSIAASDGLHTIGVFGRAVLALGWEKWPMISKISLLLAAAVAGAVAVDPTKAISSSSSDTVLLWVGFRDSKQIIPSKQSSNPSLLRASAAWTLSALVKIWFYREKRHCHQKASFKPISYTEAWFSEPDTYNFPNG